MPERIGITDPNTFSSGPIIPRSVIRKQGTPPIAEIRFFGHFKGIFHIEPQKHYKQQRSRARKILLGSQSHLIGTFSDNFAAVDIRKEP